MKKIFVSVLAVIFVLAVYLNEKHTSYALAEKSQGEKVTMATPDHDNEPLRTVTSSPDFAVMYTNLDQLVEKATLIVEGQVTDISYFDYNTKTYTKALVKVTKSYNSNAKEGDVLTFAEPGGITTQAALIRSIGNKFNQPITEVEENTKVQVLFAGEPLLRANENVLFFGGVGKLPMLPGKYYVSLGTFQGRFKIDGDSIERYAPKEMQSSSYSSLKMNKGDFDQKLSDAVKNIK